MEFQEVLARRRMVRNYDPRPLDADSLQRVANAALRAPSAGNTQGVSVVVVTEPGARSAIAGLAGEAEYVSRGFDPWISRAPAHLVITVSEQAYHERYREPDKTGPDGEEIEWPVPYWWVDAGAALMAVLLAAVDEGLAAGFLGTHAMPELAGILGIPETHRPIGVVTIGRGMADRRSSSLGRARKDPGPAIHHERWRG
ncbi:MAG: nitroreductase family protein [Acidimicrobiia bacterium]